MPLREAQAIVLRTYPLKEADKIVVFFTREYGKCRGVSRGARRLKNGFGGSLEPLSEIRVGFFERPRKDLVSIDRCDLESSMMHLAGGDMSRVLSLAYIAEVADRMLPEHEVNDASYRLLRLVLGKIREGLPVWLPLTYYLYWMVRLGGFLPSLASCAGCGAAIAADQPAYYAGDGSGLRCRNCRPRQGNEMAASERGLASLLARSLAELPGDGWESGRRGRELRRFLHAVIEAQIEAQLKSWKLLEELENEPEIQEKL